MKIKNRLPRSLRSLAMTCSPYFRLMRFHRPIGIWLLLWPTFWALWIAGNGHPSLKNMIIFVVGTIIMRAAGCVINDIADRNIDKHVARTKDRPLTSGEVSLKEALIVFFILLIFAFILLLQLNILCFKLALIALFLACFYPFTKRWTYWPQLVLGLAFAMSVPIAFAAEVNHLPASSWLIYSIAVIWPLMYDTQYGVVDQEDDVKIGVKSTAILFGKYNYVMIGLLQIVIVILVGFLNNISALLAAGFFAYQQYLMKHNKYFQAFLNNAWAGLAIFIPLVVSCGHNFQ